MITKYKGSFSRRDTEKKLVVTNRENEVGRGNIGMEDKQVQTIRPKISYKDIVYISRYMNSSEKVFIISIVCQGLSSWLQQ